MLRSRQENTETPVVQEFKRPLFGSISMGPVLMGGRCHAASAEERARLELQEAVQLRSLQVVPPCGAGGRPTAADGRPVITLALDRAQRGASPRDFDVHTERNGKRITPSFF